MANRERQRFEGEAIEVVVEHMPPTNKFVAKAARPELSRRGEETNILAKGWSGHTKLKGAEADTVYEALANLLYASMVGIKVSAL